VRRFYDQFHVIARRQSVRWKIAVDDDSSENGSIGAEHFSAAHAIDDDARY
jgi:hypothetical protein